MKTALTAPSSRIAAAGLAHPLRAARGFTLIELVCVIVILGCLSAVAVPRYVDLTAEAYRASVDGTSGAFSSALALAMAGCVIKGWAGADNLPGYGASDVDFNADCFPTDTSGNANTIANNDNRCLRVWDAILAAAPTITTSAAGADYQASAASNVCTYLFLEDQGATRQFTYNSLTGEVALTNP